MGFSAQTCERRTVVERCLEARKSQVLAEIRQGLLKSPKEISSKHFYDARGSELFEKICELPEYYQTRTEHSLLRSVAARVATVTGAEELVELGSGAATKTPVLLDAMEEQGNLRLYVPFDVSESTVRAVADDFAEKYEELRIHGVIGDFMSQLDRIPLGKQRLVIFLGGTLGNLTEADATKFLRRLAATMSPDEYFLLGTDLIKNVERIEAAYNDTSGVTAEFNRNALRVLNTLVDANFDPEQFEHYAFYNSDRDWIEMRLRSQSHQQVRLPALDLTISVAPGEEILTEISTKYDRRRVESLFDDSGFALEQWFTDPEQLFALSLARRL